MPRPPVIFAKDGDARVVVRRETLRGPGGARCLSEARIGLLGRGTVGGAFADLVESSAEQSPRSPAARPADQRRPAPIRGGLRRDPRRIGHRRRADRRHRSGARLRPARARGRQARRHRQQAARSRSTAKSCSPRRGPTASSSASRPRSPASCRSIRVIQESLAATEITKVFGIVNGTTNFILTEMARTGASYRRGARARAGARLRRGGSDRRRRRRRRRGEDGDPRSPRLRHAGAARRRLVRGHHRDPARRHGLCEGARPVAEASRRRRDRRRAA